jgi:hypothetical protein
MKSIPRIIPVLLTAVTLAHSQDEISSVSGDFALIAGGINSFADSKGDTHSMLMGWGNVDIDRMAEGKSTPAQGHHPQLLAHGKARRQRERRVQVKHSFLIPISGLWLLTSGFAFAILDTNNNGLSDFWERDFNNGSLFDEFFNPQGDADSDGWTNAQEAAAGTNPFDPNPPDGIIRPVTGHIPAVWSEPDEFNEIIDKLANIRAQFPVTSGHD